MNIDKSFLEQLLALFFGRPAVTDFAVMGEGKENTSIKVTLADNTPYILRIWGETHSAIGVRRRSDIEGELDFMIHCHDQGIAVPKVYLSLAGRRFETTDSGSYYAVMDFVSGELPVNPTPDMIRQIAAAVARMNKLSAAYQFPGARSWPGSLLEIAEKRLRLVPELPQAAPYMDYLTPIREAFQEALGNVALDELPRGPIHGDLFWENLKFDHGKLQGIFDFDDCRDSYFLEDIAESLTNDFDKIDRCFFGEHGENVQTFLDAYGAIRPLTGKEKQLLPLFLTANYASRVVRLLTKTVDGELVYLDRVAAYRDRYLQNQSFFLPTT